MFWINKYIKKKKTKEYFFFYMDVGRRCIDADKDTGAPGQSETKGCG